MKLPLLMVCLFYAAGVLAAEAVSPAVTWLLVISLATAALAMSWLRVRQVLLYPFIALVGLTNVCLHNAPLSPFDLRKLLGTEPHLATVRGKLIESPAFRVYERADQPYWRTQARIYVSAICLNKETWQPATGTLAITTPGVLTNLYSGQIVEVIGVVALPPGATAERMFDYRQNLKLQGIYYLLRAESDKDWQVLSSPRSRPLADRFSDWARAALRLGLPAEDESLRLEWALALGWKTALTEQASEPFVRAATYHIFAVDGLRMAIVFGIFFSVLRAAGVPRSLGGLILLPLIWFYVALTGWPASAIRASAMLTVILVGWALKRPGNSLNSLFAAALAILLWQPQQLFQAGFQLSFFVVLCLILTVRSFSEIFHRLIAPDPLLPAKLRRRLPGLVGVPARYFGEVTLTSLAAWVGSLPLVAYYFNIITPVSTPANVLAVPLCVLVLVSNLISLLFAAWLPAAAEVFNHAGWFLMECIRVSSHWFANWPAAFAYTEAPSLFSIALYYALLLAVMTGWLFRPAFRPAKIGMVAFAVVAWLWVFYLNANTTRISVLPVGGGMCIYCNPPGLRNDLVVDTGPSNSVNYVIRNFLRAQGVNRVPKLLLTHGDVHHIGGTEALMDLFAGRTVFTSPVRFRSTGYRRMIERLQIGAKEIHPVQEKDDIAGWTVLHPRASDRFSKADDGAIVLASTLAGTRVILLSDLGREGQAKLLERNNDLRADIVVAGLPTTDEPLGEALLNAVQPQLIIIADSEFPFSERARPALKSRLARRRAVLFTSETGAVTLEFRSNQWKVRLISGRTLSGAGSNDGRTKPDERPTLSVRAR